MLQFVGMLLIPLNTKILIDVNNINNVVKINSTATTKPPYNKGAGFDHKFPIDEVENITELLKIQRNIEKLILLKDLQNENIDNLKKNQQISDTMYDNDEFKESIKKIDMFKGGLMTDWNFDFE